VPIVHDCAHGVIDQSNNHVAEERVPVVQIASFYPTKLIAAGEGGIVASNATGVVAAVRALRSYRDKPPSGRLLNDNFTDLEASIARVQLSKLAQTLALRVKRAEDYRAELTPLQDGGWLRLPEARVDRTWYRFAVSLCRHRAAAVGAAL